MKKSILIIFQNFFEMFFNKQKNIFLVTQKAREVKKKMLTVFIIKSCFDFLQNFHFFPFYCYKFSAFSKGTFISKNVLIKKFSTE